MSKYRVLKEYKQNLTYLQDVLGSGTTNNIELNNIGSYLFGDGAFMQVMKNLY